MASHTRTELLTTGRVISACVVSGSLAGWLLLKATPQWPTDSLLLKVFVPDPLVRPFVLAAPALLAGHKIALDRGGKRSLAVMGQTAFGIGIAAACSFFIIQRDWKGSLLFRDTSNLPFGAFLGLMCFYHLAEWASVAIFNPTVVSDDSFLTNERHFTAAMLFSLTEYFLQRAYLPSLKGWLPVCALGLGGMIFGEVFRKGALYCAKHNFTHQIEDRGKRNEHKLVTTGVYALSRHPGYFGWFVWSISTQLLLCNPLSSLLFARVSWQFFHDRIPYEEYHLERFFGEQWRDFKRRVPTRIPFIE